MNITTRLSEVLADPVAQTVAGFGEVAAELGSTLYVVGGAVRDALLGRPVSDIDLVIVGDVGRFASAVERAGMATLDGRSQFLTAKLSAVGTVFDVVTARRESYAEPGALPEVEPADLETDLKRRDFSINAMAASVAPDGSFGTLVDPHGGLAAIEDRSIRTLHSSSFRDDATRILRAARYASRLGWELESETESWLRQDTHYLRTISGDRLRNEFNRGWADGEPAAALSLLDEWGALKSIHPGIPWSAQVAANLVEARAIRPVDIDLDATCWAVIGLGLSDSGVTDSLAARLNLTPYERRAMRVGAAWSESDGRRFREDLAKGMSVSEIRRALASVDPAAVVAACASESNPIKNALRAHIDHYRTVRPVLRGQDLLQMGIPEGPMVGEILGRLRDAVLDGRTSSESGERALVRRWTERHGTG